MQLFLMFGMNKGLMSTRLQHLHWKGLTDVFILLGEFIGPKNDIYALYELFELKMEQLTI